MVLQILDEKRVKQIEFLSNSTILTDEAWDKFKQLFEQVYPGFIVRLNQHLPNLTPSEIRLLTLTKIKLSTRQMAATLGVSPDTIKKSRHRLRKKMDISQDESLDDIIKLI